jgi:hypothetical protein
MANLKNFLPPMTLSEREWFDKCPKAVLFEIARQFAMRVADDYTEDAAFATMQNEWDVLHSQGLVPQKPFKARSVEAILSKMHPEIREHFDDAGNFVQQN